MSTPLTRSLLALATGLLMLQTASANEAAIRKNLAERLPNLPAIDEVSPTPIPGVFEVRLGTEIVYTDDKGNYVFQGNLIDTKTRTSLTEARINKLTAIDFDSLPLKDALVLKLGTGERKMVVFSDPNCGYCKKLERDIQKLKNVTVYTFLYPILGADSQDKAKNIWCSKEQTKTWLAWMLDGKVPPKSMGECSTPLERNVAMGQKYRVQGTPAMVFVDGTRVPGALGTEQIEKQLVASASGKPAEKK
jgi:thiol:disulfide interchange protein DsbC